MRLYHWKCDSYGEEATVAAPSIGIARECLLQQKKGAAQLSKLDKVERFSAEYTNKIIDDMLSERGYHVESYCVGEVVWTEVS